MKSTSLFRALAVSVFLLAQGVPAADSSANYTVGGKAPAFEAKSTDGKTIKFPEDYKGKVVLLDFWATWCGPCRSEMPNVVSAYNQYHAKGFEVVGISLDKENSWGAVTKSTTEHSMPWPQIYDGKFWKAAVAQ